MTKTVLLADDSLTIQKVVGITFANEDVELITVADGDDALATTRRARPDVVLADVTMPGLSGYDLCEAIKSDPDLRAIPVLLLTGTFDSYDQRRAKAVGAAGFIAKPFEARALIEQVNQLLDAPPETADDGESSTTPETDTADELSPEADEARDFGLSQTLEILPNGEDPNFRTRALDAAERGDWPALRDSPASVRNDADDVPEPLEDLPDTGFFAPSESDTEELPELPAPDDDDQAHSQVLGDSSTLGAGGASDAESSGPWLTGADTMIRSDGSRESAGASASDSASALPWVDPEPVAAKARGLTSLEMDRAALEEPAPHGRDGRDARDEITEPDGERGNRSMSDSARVAALPPLPSINDPIEPPAARSRAAGGVDARDVRGDLTAAIEKIAWEAFGGMSEEIVREIVNRVEAIAWEAVPAIAERILREQIEQLKSDGSDG